MADIFLSYAREDRARVVPLAEYLMAQGWTVWWDPKIRTGQEWADVIERELDQAKCVVVVWSQASVGNGWVRKEARRGLKREILMPARIENVEIPLEFEDVQAADLIDWEGHLPHSGIDGLLDDLSTLLGLPKVEVEKVPPATPRKPTPPEGMVLVPEGAFQYGDERKVCPLDYDYYIDIYPVTNQQYNKFYKAGGYLNEEYWSQEGRKWKERWKWIGMRIGIVTQPAFWEDAEWNRLDHPVVGVSWYEAEAYAKWAGKRLPTEQEWEKAARGADGRVYPWGDEFDKEKCNSDESGIGRTTPVTQYVNGISPYGCSDMAGNVWEWMSSNYDDNGNFKVQRGGSWVHSAWVVRSAARGSGYPSARPNGNGFRCARDAR
jgi:formylglycine-generating enzyme required for sulfatase activity